MSQADEQLQALVAAVSSTKKYSQVSPDLIRAIGRRELSNRPSWKEAVKATKSKLHQVAGAYQNTKIDYDNALKLLIESKDSPDQHREACLEIMRQHVSSRERLPILADFFQRSLVETTKIQTVLDIACGLNPLAMPWMPFDNQIEYIACDIYADAVSFLAEYMNLMGINGRAEVRDVVQYPPRQKVDLAFILKSLPCLEQLQKGATHRLLDAVQARYMLISYPVTSLGGRRKGMIANYDAQFENLAVTYNWSFNRYEYATELAFLVKI
ncbi:MAG: hypothetical protein R3293_00770 [Candidatus Promineifilaceae bacterium]|nr:hypothetical protein [Candidatus Promineifilaceae bacterium]